MNISKDKCNSCGAETINRYDEKGWISIEGATISISKYRRKDGNAVTGYSNDRDLDFCSIKCLIDFINKLIGDTK